MSTCCVFGGSGFIGSQLVAHLANGGWNVVVVTRYPPRAGHLRVLPRVRILEGDVADEAATAATLFGCGYAVNLIGILNERGRDGSGFSRVHEELAARLVRACETAGTRRLVHVSALNAGAGEGRSHYLRSKGAGEDRVRDSALDWTIIRPSIVFGPGDSFLNRFAALLRRIPFVLPLPMADARMAPVHVADVVAGITACLQRPDTIGREYEFCGPDVWRLREIVALLARTLRLRRRVVGVPPRLARAQAAVMDFVPGKPFSTDNLRTLELDSICRGPGLAELGIRPRSLGGHAAGSLTGSGRPTRLDRYRASAGRLTRLRS